MDYKRKAIDYLKLFCQEFGVTDKLIFDVSKEHACKRNKFTKEVRRQGINYHICEPDLHKQNPFMSAIREVIGKWHRSMVRKTAPRQLWDYGVSWVSEVMSKTNCSENSANGGIPLKNVTDEIDDISEYLEFYFYEKLWFKGNADISPSEPGRCLGISHRTGSLMCYYILTQTGTAISRSTLQRVTNIYLSTDEVKEAFVRFDTGIHRRLKEDNHVYEGSKPIPQDWADMSEADTEFAEEFKRVFNNYDITEAEHFKPEGLEDTHVDMDISLPRYGEGPEFSNV